MNCDALDLVAYLKGELAPDGREAVKLHLQQCGGCAVELQKLEGVSAAWTGLTQVEPSAHFADRVRREFLARNPGVLRSLDSRTSQVPTLASLIRSLFDLPSWTLSACAHVVVLAILAGVLLAPSDVEAQRADTVSALLPRDEEGRWPMEYRGDPLDVLHLPVGSGEGRSEDLDPSDLREPLVPEVTEPVGPPSRKSDPRSFDRAQWTYERMEPDRRTLGFIAPRTDPVEKLRARREAGMEGTAESLNRALEWLATSQSSDGSWEAPQGEAGSFKVGVSGLALLAFLGDGHSHRQGSYREVVQKGLTYLRSQQQESGLIGAPDSNCLYDHAVAAIALLEARLLGGDDALQAPLASAVAFTIRAQNREGGWGYIPGSPESDSSVMAWQILLLRLYRWIDPDLPVAPLNLARARMDALTSAADGRVGYRKVGQHPHREFATTAAGMLSHLLCRPVVDRDLLQQQARVLLAEDQPVVQPSARRFSENDLYFWYFGSLSMVQSGGDSWRLWRERLMDGLLTAQTDDGSWPATFDKWAIYGGPVYTTSMAALILESAYRYPRWAR